MLIFPPGHAGTARASWRLRRRELWMVRAVAAAVVALIVVLVVSLASSGQSSGHGCLHFTTAAPTGAQEIDQCGAAARAICATARAPGAFPAAARPTVIANCRKARLRVGG
jgi:hypothetical protein